MTPKQSGLGYLVDLGVQLQRDADRPDAELHRRDRAMIGTRAPAASDAHSLLTAWLDALRETRDDLPGRAVAALYRLNVAVLALVGLLVGWAAAAVVFHYDGTRPVNVVNVLGVFVAAQAVLLVLFGVAMLPTRALRFLPGAAAAREALGWLSPGHLIHVLLRRLPAALRDGLARAFRQGSSFGRHFGVVRKWGVALASQTFALAFNAGALLCFLYLVTFSDLAFRWSTTLEPSFGKIESLTRMVASPWAHLVPAAVPSDDLIRDTLYYQAGSPTAADPERWGGWWPFLAACMIVYGALPRLLLLLLAAWRFRCSIDRAFGDAPGAAMLLERLRSQWVTTQAISPEAVPAPAAYVAAGKAESCVAAPDRVCVVNWGGLELGDEALRDHFGRAWRREVLAIYRAGGKASVETDAATAAALGDAPADVGVVVLVKAWEPPMLEILDFLGDIRRACGAARPILVAPVDWVSPGAPSTCSAAELGQWRRRLSVTGDPGLRVASWPEGGGA